MRGVGKEKEYLSFLIRFFSVGKKKEAVNSLVSEGLNVIMTQICFYF